MTFLDVVNTVLIALSILVLLPIAVFSIECFAAVLLRNGPGRMSLRHAASQTAVATADSENRPRAVVLIPAHNEQLVIEQTLDAIRSSQSAATENSVLVIADNCDDQTAELAGRTGAKVVVRIDSDHRGKGYALHSGLQSLRDNPPDVVVVIDADCLPQPQTIDTLARLAWSTQRPVQALNLTDRNAAAGPIQAVSLLGNRFTNMIRPLGLLSLGVPCRLMGTGMAIPWRLAENVELAGGSLVEDMQLGIDLTLQGHLPLFCPDARVTSALPPADRAFVSQRTRWDHGHLRTAAVQIPPLLAAALRRRSWPLLGVALDLSIPPLTLLVALWLGAAILAGVAWWFGASWTPMALLAGGGAALAAALGLGWAVFCRRQVSLLAFAAVPLYMFRKLPIYARLLFRRQHAWVRTERL
jgi:cellulose synthase/poly-beta-1,6-N-acetylglucosamine synthase-like glycosyltransferase